MTSDPPAEHQTKTTITSMSFGPSCEASGTTAVERRTPTASGSLTYSTTADSRATANQSRSAITPAITRKVTARAVIESACHSTRRVNAENHRHEDELSDLIPDFDFASCGVALGEMTPKHKTEEPDREFTHGEVGLQPASSLRYGE